MDTYSVHTLPSGAASLALGAAASVAGVSTEAELMTCGELNTYDKT